MNKIAAIIAPFVLAYVVLWLFNVNPMASLAIFVSLGLAVLVALDGLNFIKVLPGKGLLSTTPLAVIAAIALVASGGLAIFLGPAFAPANLAGSLTGSVTGATTPVVTPSTVTAASTSSCIALAREINPDNVGKAAVPLLTAYDYESNTPTSANVDTAAYVYVNGVYSDTVSTKGAAISNRVNVGDVVSIYGGNNSATGYYLEPVESYCVTKTNEPIALRAHNFTGKSGTAFITGYDSTGSATLSAGTVAGEEDYDITLSANQKDVFYIKFQNLHSNSAFQLSAVATRVTNDIDSCGPHADDSGLWSESVIPKFLKNVQLTNGTGTSGNITGGYSSVWKLKTPVLISEFDDVKYKFTIVAGATNPATAAGDLSASDNCVVSFFDGGWSKDENNQPYFDIYTHDTAQSNLAQARDISDGTTYNTVIGKYYSTLIEGI